MCVWGGGACFHYNHNNSGADPGFLKGGAILGLQAKRGGSKGGVQLWAQC